MTCKCGSERIAHFQAKHSDMAHIQIPHLDIDGNRLPYLDDAMGRRFMGGDYIRFCFCLDCGTIQNFVSPTDQELCEEL